MVYSESGKIFTLYLNDEKINELPQSDVKAYNINEGWQKIKIEFNDEKDKSIIKDSILIKQLEKNENAEFVYIIRDASRKKRVPHELEFNSQIELSGPLIPKIPDPPKEVIPLVDSAVYGNLYKARNNRPVFFENYNVEDQKCKTDLTDKDIKYALNLVDKTNDFEDRFKYIGKTIDQNCYTTAQLVVLLNLLEIEMDKLKIAQRAYPHLKDKNNAMDVSKAFKYPTIKEEYVAFLKALSIKRDQQKLNCTVPLSDDQFETVFQAVKKVPNEYDKTKFGKKQLETNCYNCAQIARLMGLFAHDREKLEFARSSFSVVTDKTNFEKLAEEFQFSETKGEFLKSISK